MNTSILNFNIVRTPETRYSDAQIFLREFTGKSFSRAAADALWRQVVAHQRNVSKSLRRDIGLRVAAVDFMENFYDPRIQTERKTSAGELSDSFGGTIRKYLRRFFEASGRSLNY